MALKLSSPYPSVDMHIEYNHLTATLSKIVTPTKSSKIDVERVLTILYGMFLRNCFEGSLPSSYIMFVSYCRCYLLT